MKRKFLTVFGFASGIVAGSVVFRRSFAKPRDRVDVYFDDGSMVSLAAGSPDADALLPTAQQILAQVQAGAA